MEENKEKRKRNRHDSDWESSKDLLNMLMLNDAENGDPSVLDSVIKSFEQEILPPPPNLGYLLEASDDELGLPPTVVLSQEEPKPDLDSGRVAPDGVDLLGLEDDVGNYQGFGLMAYDVDLDLDVDEDVQDNGGGYVTIDGLFNYAEPDILWRSESLQAM
ncbi:hypothetical protein VNO78_10096 [Psophocarpus tetragonolobus]|uniref:Uncharacterized protein n=1 Tax=Psophocarpus tetragonolobus TaxID=3891 RepID=A0AAN9SJM0_PSOTE